MTFYALRGAVFEEKNSPSGHASVSDPGLTWNKKKKKERNPLRNPPVCAQELHCAGAHGRVLIEKKSFQKLFPVKRGRLRSETSGL